MPTRKLSRVRDSRGQSLVETTLMIPLLLLLILNAVNVGYFFLVTLNLTAAARNGIEWAVQGSSTPTNNSLPTADAVSSVISADMGSLKSGTLQVQVCSPNLGSSKVSPPTSICQTSAKGVTFSTPDPDPESDTGFALSRVDVSYKFDTLIPATPFNLVVASFPTCKSSGGEVTCTFTRHAEMRAMGS